MGNIWEDIYQGAIVRNSLAQNESTWLTAFIKSTSPRGKAIDLGCGTV